MDKFVAMQKRMEAAEPAVEEEFDGPPPRREHPDPKGMIAWLYEPLDEESEPLDEESERSEPVDP